MSTTCFDPDAIDNPISEPDRGPFRESAHPLYFCATLVIEAKWCTGGGGRYDK